MHFRHPVLAYHAAGFFFNKNLGLSMRGEGMNEDFLKIKGITKKSKKVKGKIKSVINGLTEAYRD